MSLPTANLEQAWLAAVGELSRVNGSIEVHARNPADASATPFNARVLEADASTGSLVLERPPSLPAALLGPAGGVRLFLQVGETRLAARSRVARTGRYRLNPQTRVTAVALDPVTDVTTSQRRACFRVSMLGDGSAGVRFIHPEHPENPPLDGTLVDLSETGIGLTCTLTPAEARTLCRSHVRLVLQLEPDEPPLELDAQVVRLDPQPRDACRLGLRFAFATVPERQAAERRIQKVAAERQRLQLRRHREAG